MGIVPVCLIGSLTDNGLSVYSVAAIVSTQTFYLRLLRFNRVTVNTSVQTPSTTGKLSAPVLDS